MNLLLISGLCIITISIIANVLTRLSLKKKSNELAVRIRAIKTGKEAFIDIETDVKNNFNKHIISHSEEKQFTDYYSDIFHDADSLLKRLDKFHINPPAIIAKFTHDFKCIHSIIIRHNEDVIKYTLDTYKNFFDHCLKYPLDKQQRRSIISEEDNCLVVSSAGSGKTSSIIGKVKYLIDIKHVNPQNILLISYTNKAAAELTERMGAADLKGYTFHKLALELIGKTTGKKPSICDNPNALFVEIYHILLNNKNFKRSIVKYFYPPRMKNAYGTGTSIKKSETLYSPHCLVKECSKPSCHVLQVDDNMAISISLIFLLRPSLVWCSPAMQGCPPKRDTLSLIHSRALIMSFVPLFPESSYSSP